MQKSDAKEPRLSRDKLAWYIYKKRYQSSANMTPNHLNWTDGKITPLVFAAVTFGDVNVFKFLLEKAEDKNPIVAKHRNWTLLHIFAKAGQMEMCRLSVEK